MPIVLDSVSGTRRHFESHKGTRVQRKALKKKAASSKSSCFQVLALQTICSRWQPHSLRHTFAEKAAFQYVIKRRCYTPVGLRGSIWIYSPLSEPMVIPLEHSTTRRQGRPNRRRKKRRCCTIPWTKGRRARISPVATRVVDEQPAVRRQRRGRHTLDLDHAKHG